MRKTLVKYLDLFSLHFFIMLKFIYAYFATF